MNTGGALFMSRSGYSILNGDFCAFLHSLPKNARKTTEIIPHFIGNSFTKHPTIHFYEL